MHGAPLPNRVTASRHSTGVTYSLARNSCLNMSMRLECAICGRGAEFPRASARRCLTFPHGVCSAHRFSSRSFSSPTRCTGFADSPFLYILQGQLLSSSPSDNLACHFFTQGGARNKFLPFHWTLKWNFIHNRAIYFRPGANAVRSHGSRDS